MAIELDDFSVCMLFPAPVAFHGLQRKRPMADRFLNDARSFNGVSSDDAMASGFAIVRFACEQSHLAGQVLALLRSAEWL
ncbi:hypothetical protein V1282_006143 [Nitrobacteraceae bacterium AZCC 2146]